MNLGVLLIVLVILVAMLAHGGLGLAMILVGFVLLLLPEIRT